MAHRHTPLADLSPAPATDETLTFVFGPQEAGTRLDVALAARLTDLSRSAVRKLFDRGLVALAGRAAKPGLRLEEGLTVTVTFPPAAHTIAEPQDIPIEILHEDNDIVVVDKPAGIVCHPGPGNPDGTLVNALLHHCGALSGLSGEGRPGIVHRLDKGTSGVMVVAKNDTAHRRLAAQFKDRTLKKTYLAVVWDNIVAEKGSVNLPIGRDRRDRQRISPRTAHPREAVTNFRVLKRFGPFTLLEVTPLTGRTHQIRVHLAQILHPVVGDPLYGRQTKRTHLHPPWRGLLAALNRPLLHAWKLRFRHPSTNEQVEFVAPPPREMQPFTGEETS